MAELPLPDVHDLPFLAVLRCGRCQGMTFPALAYGCRHCGAEPKDGATEQIPARGTLRNYVTVHADLVRDVAVPFVVGEVDFGQGIREEVLLEVSGEAELVPGMTVRGILRTSAPGTERFPLRFVPVPEEVSA
ncbi:hypothetical protein D9M68_602380 [compost metagenome]